MPRFHSINNVNIPFTADEEAEYDSREAAAVAEQRANQYKIDRVSEYPPMSDYLDGIVKGDQAQVQAYIDACLAIKTKYPKG